MKREEEIKIKALSEYRIKEKENKKCTGTYDANLSRRKAFIQGAEWADKTMIERVEQWLIKNNRGQTIGSLHRFLEEE